MAVYTYELSTEHNYPGISVYKKLEDGVHYAWEIRANDGYVFYDTTENNMEPVFDPETGDMVFDPETGEPVMRPVTYYYTIASLPLRFNFANFPWVAVPRDSVDENYIFGVGNDHVTI